MPARTFKFRLQSVLEYKQRREDDEKRVLAQKLEMLAGEQAKLRSLEALRQQRQHELAEKSEKGLLNVEELKMYHEQQKKLAKEISAQNIKIQQAQAEVELQKQKLLAAVQERKTYEKIKEKHYQEYLAEVNLEEQKALDEIATTKFNRETDKFF